MRIPPDFYNQIRNQVRISDVIRQRVALAKKGSEYSGLCPFHSEKTPSFTVNDQKRFYHCFGCHAHGDVIRFVSETRGMSYPEATLALAGENGIEIPKMTREEKKLYDEADQIYSVLELAKNFFMSELTQDAREYLHKRGISDEIIKKFSIGYARGKGHLQEFFKKKSIKEEDLIKSGLVGRDQNGRIYEVFSERIIFPILNIYNKVVGFGGRVMGDSMPKYLNSPETLVFKKGETMYGENFATSAAYKKNHFIVVEGYMDVIALNIAGFEETVASLGTSVTEKHLEKLWRSSDEIVICLDGDSAGIRASNRLIDMSLPHISYDKSISFVELPDNLDPDDIIKKGGSNLLDKLLAQKKTLSEMIWKTEYQGKSFTSAESKAALEKKLENYAKQINDHSLASSFRRYFKEQVWNNLISNKKQGSNYKATGYKNKPNLTFSKNLLAIDNFSEKEVLENTICDFILKFPEIINSSDESKEFLESIVFSNNELSKLRDWFLEKCLSDQAPDPLTAEYVQELAKNTGFYDRCSVESNANVIFLGLAFNNNYDSQALFFQWLKQKYYLLLLQLEYTLISDRHDEDIESKSSSYIEEIQKVSAEVKRLAAFFVN